MLSDTHYAIEGLPEPGLYGFGPLERRGDTNYRWTAPCAGICLCLHGTDQEILVQVLPDSRVLNVWQDLDLYLGGVRFDHEHVRYDRESDSVALRLPEELRRSIGNRFECWLCMLISPFVNELEMRALGLAITGITIHSSTSMGLEDHLTKTPTSDFPRALSALFHSEIYRHHLRRRMGKTAVEWDEYERRDASNLSHTARRLDSLKAKLALNAFLDSGDLLRFPDIAHPDVSIVIVTHNRAELSYQCLRSILGQSDLRLEVVVVDNASCDATRQMMARTLGLSTVCNETNNGFVKGANQGAWLSHGEYLLFLNNDTELLPGCIAHALSIINRSKDIGAVGGRIVSTDGLIQEAGGIVWADGSTEHYGRGGRADAGEFMFERWVDYCSGAFMLTRRRLFEQLGGFDEAYAPGYYEDTDYCLRLWESGFRVAYSPMSVLVHHEYASGGADHARRLIAENQSTFTARHRHRLGTFLKRSAGNRLRARNREPTECRILYFGDYLPAASENSRFQGPASTLATLAANGCFVTMFASDIFPFQWEAIRGVVPRELEVVPDIGWQHIGNFVSERLGYYDCVVIAGAGNKERFNAMLTPEEKRDLQTIFIEPEELNISMFAPYMNEVLIDE